MAFKVFHRFLYSADDVIHSRTQQGNIFFVLFGAIALIGVIGAASTSLMRGPLSTVVTLNQRAKADAQMLIAARLAMLAASEAASNGDCDTDGYVEPLNPDTVTVGCSSLTGGGCLNANIGAAKKDPWGTYYGYCAWDHGSVTAACSGANVLAGENLASKTVIAIVSAGPDRTFQSSCGATPAYLSESVGSDDLVLKYNYEEASQAVDGLWKLKNGAADTATIDKKIEVQQDATFQGAAKFDAGATVGAGQLLDLKNQGGLLNLPDEIQAANCNLANDGVLRINKAGTDFKLQICNNEVPGWIDIGGSGTLLAASGASGEVQFNNAGVLGADSTFIFDATNNRLGLGGAPVDDTLDVIGTVGVTGTLSVGGLTSLAGLGATGAVDFDSTLNVDGNTTLVGTLGVTGATTLSSTLSVDGAADFNNNLNVDGATTLDETTIDGDLDLNGAADISGNVSIGGTLGVTGATTLSSTLSVDGAGDFNNGLNVDGTTTLDATTIDGNLDLNGNIDVSGNAIVGSFLRVGGSNTQGQSCVGNSGAIQYDSSNNYLLACISGTWEALGASTGGGTGGNGVGSVWTKTGSDIYYNTGSVGIGTTNPTQALTVNGNGVIDGDLSVIGGYLGTVSLISTGAGSRLLFDPESAIIRAGQVTGTQWDSGNSGLRSVGLGYNVIASGLQSVAIGNEITAAATDAMALGNEVVASGVNSFAIGLGEASTATLPTVSGARSFGIFMDDQQGVDLTATNTMALLGGKMIIDQTPATNPAVSGTLSLDVEGDIGAVQYCNEDGSTCADADTLLSGSLGISGADKQITFNDGGAFGADSLFVFDKTTDRLGIGTASPLGRLHTEDTQYDVGTGLCPSGYTEGDFDTQGDAADCRRVGIIALSSGRIGIGTNAPAITFDIRGTDAIRIPAGTTAQQPAAVNGMIRYNTDDNAFEFYQNGAWIKYLNNSSAVTAFTSLTDTPANYTGAAKKLVAVNSGAAALEFVDLYNDAGKLGVGISNPAVSLDISGTDAIRIPVGTTGQEPVAANGMIRYDSTTHKFRVVINGAWADMVTGNGSSALSSITAATQINTIANANNAQVWNWDTLTTQTGLNLGSTSMTSGSIFGVSSSSTALTGSMANFNLTGSNASNTGNVLRTSVTGTSSAAVPLMVTNLGTGLSLRVNDATGDTDTTPFVVDAVGNVGIGTASPGASSILDVTSTTGGIVFPRMTLTQRNAIASPVDGMVIYNTTNAKFDGYHNGVWRTLISFNTHSVNDTTGTIFGITGSALTTGTIFNATGNTLTSGSLISLDSSSNALTGSLLNASYTGTGTGNGIRTSAGAGSAAVPLMVTNLGTGLSLRVNDATGDTDTTPFVVDASGNVGIGTASPSVELDVVGTGAIKIPSGTTAQRPTAANGMIRYNSDNNVFEFYENGSWASYASSSSSVFERNGTVIRSKLPTVNSTDDFVFGSSQLADTGTSSDDARFWFDKSKAAFRAGEVTATQWDDVSVGSYSTGFGYNTTASGQHATAFGRSTVASGYSSSAFGYAAEANGDYSISMGLETKVTSAGTYSMALGLGNSSNSTYPQVSGVSSLGVFLGDQNGVNLSDANTVSIMGASGGFGIGTVSPVVSLDIFGTDAIRIPAGTTGQEPAAANGMIRYDSTTNKFRVVINGAWADVATGTTTSSLSGLTAATQINTIANANFAQTWNWDTLSTQTALALGSTSITSGRVLNVSSSSTAMTGELAHFILSGNDVANTGSVVRSAVTGASSAAVPLMVTNLGTGLSLRVNDATGDTDTTPFVVDAAGNVGVGTASPTVELDVSGTGAIKIPSGTTGAEPAAANGMIRYDSTTNKFRVVINGAWADVATGTTTSSLSGLTAATQINTIANANFAQTWNWDTLSTQTALALGSTSITSGRVLNVSSSSTAMTGELAHFILSGNDVANTGSVVRSAVTGASSAAVPLMVTNLGTGLSLRVNDATGDTDTTPFVVDAAGNVGVGTASPTVELDVSGTGAIKIPSGTTGQEPAAANGMIRYDSTTNKFRVVINGAWADVATGSGGTAALSSLTAATGINTIANANNAQVWNWDTLTTQTGLNLGSTSMTSGTIFEVSSSSTALTGSMANFNLTGSNASNTGNVLRTSVTGTSSAAVPLMVTNLGTGLSLRVNDATGDTDTTPFVVDAVGNVGIGTASPGASSILDVTSTTGGIVFPRMTLTQRNAIASPVDGMVIYNTTNAKFDGYHSGAWRTILSFTTHSISDTVGAIFGITGNSLTSGRLIELLSSSSSLTGSLLNASYTGTGTGNAIRASTGSSSAGVPLMVTNLGSGISFRVNDATDDADTTPFVVSASGNVGIGTASPSTALDVVGDIQYTGTITDISDRRLKKDIVPLSANMASNLYKVKTYSFKMKNDPTEKTEFGVMAQELETLFPDLVKTANDEIKTKSVNYMGLIAPMIQSIQDLKNQNDALKKEISVLKNKPNMGGNNINYALLFGIGFVFMMLSSFMGAGVVYFFLRPRLGQK